MIGLLSTCLLLAASAFAQTASDIDRARVIAQGHVDGEALDFPADLAGAKVANDPVYCYDLDGDVSACIFDVLRNGKPAGFVTVALTNDGPKVVEGCNGTSPAQKRQMLLTTRQQNGLGLATSGSSAFGRLIYVGGIDYFVSLPAVSPQRKADYVCLTDFTQAEPAKLLQMQTARRTSLAKSPRPAVARSAIRPMAVNPRGNDALFLEFPRSGSVIARGTTTYIAWTAQGNVRNVRIELWKGFQFVKRLASSVSVFDELWKWNVPSDLVPDSDYQIKILDADGPDTFDITGFNANGIGLVITGSKILDIDAFLEYRGAGTAATSMIIQYYSKRGFPSMREGAQWFDWQGADGELEHIYTTRRISDLLSDAGGFPKTGGTALDYINSYENLFQSFETVMSSTFNFDDFQTSMSVGTTADGFRNSIDQGLPGVLSRTAEWGANGLCYFGYSYFTNSATPVNHTIYVASTHDRYRHSVVFENQGTTTGTVFNSATYPPPLMDVAFPSTAGITLSRGQNTTIRWGSWASQKGVSKVNIDLLRNGAKLMTIGSSVSNSGSFNWQVPFNLATGTGFKVRITATNDPKVKDESFAPFSVPGVAKVSSPNTRTTWRLGGSGQIRWQGFTGPTVRIQLIKGSSVVQTISSSTENDGFYTWPVPATLRTGSDYWVRVISNYDNRSDSSDVAFAVSTQPRVTSPVAGAIWTAGESHVIRWTGFRGASVKIELMQAGTAVTTIVASTPNDGSFSWKPASDLPAASDYTIRVSSTSFADGASSPKLSVEAAPVTQ